MLPATNKNAESTQDKISAAEIDLRINDSFIYIKKSLERAKEARLNRKNLK